MIINLNIHQLYYILFFKILQEFKNWIDYEKQNKEKIKNANELIEMQETILSAYEKEKEKNRTLKTYKSNLPDNVELICLCKNDFERNISDDYISKDKIKAKIEYLLKRYDSEEDFCSYDVLISILQSLLKEE